jgi:hypothetical protein
MRKKNGDNREITRLYDEDDSVVGTLQKMKDSNELSNSNVDVWGRHWEHGGRIRIR